MKKIKIIYSSEIKLIQNYIRDNIKEYKKISFDSSDSFTNNLNNFLFECSQSSLLNNSSAFLINVDQSLSKKLESNDFDIIEKLSKLEKEIYLVSEVDKIKESKELLNFAEMIYIPKLSYWGMSSMIEKILKENGIKYDQNSLSLLKSKLTCDPWIIENELKKIILNCKVLTQDFINSNIIDYNNNSQYKMIEYFFKKNYSKALGIFDELFSQKKSIDEILAMFISYIFNLKIMSSYLDLNNKTSLSEEFGIQKFQEDQYLSIIRSTSKDNIDKLLNILIELDKGIKLGLKDPYNSFKLLISGGVYG